MPKKSGPVPAAPSGAQVPAEQFDMVFHCQLAHGSPTKQVRDFTNVKQLYESIAKAFGIPTSDVSGGGTQGKRRRAGERRARPGGAQAERRSEKVRRNWRVRGS